MLGGIVRGSHDYSGRNLVVIKLTSGSRYNDIHPNRGKEPSLITPAERSHADRLNKAIRQNGALSRQGLLELLFAQMFKGLVYPQIWEDPDIDMEALAIKPDSHVVAIASGGCNILSYLIADPARITALDLNKAHIALNRLKLTAARELPDLGCVLSLLRRGRRDSQRRCLLAVSRAAARPRNPQPIGKAGTSSGSDRGEFRYFRAISTAMARSAISSASSTRSHAPMASIREHALRARTLDEQRTFFQTHMAPLFDKRLVRWMASRQLALYGLGIPPAQYAALASAGGGDMASVMRAAGRTSSPAISVSTTIISPGRRFGRSYGDRDAGPLPPYLKRERFELVRQRSDRVGSVNRSFTEYLESRPDRSLDRYVLLDAQDWMTDAQLNALWREITRTARPGARVIFRTAAEPTLLPGRVDDAILNTGTTKRRPRATIHARDRSAIYGGFHLYVLAATEPWLAHSRR